MKPHKKPKKVRPAGKVLLEMEPLLFELVKDHELQRGEVLALIKCWVDIHYPQAIEQYTTGGSPVYNYGPAKKR